MKTDVYTKTVLTVIAACLLALVLRNTTIVTQARAESPTGFYPAKSDYALVPINEDGSINVRMAPEGVVDVRIRGIDEASNLRWEAINVRVSN